MDRDRVGGERDVEDGVAVQIGEPERVGDRARHREGRRRAEAASAEQLAAKLDNLMLRFRHCVPLPLA